MKAKTKNTKDKYAQPPFSTGKQKPPGVEKKMKPKADHGEQSYKGYHRFKNKVVVITGGDSGIGKAIAIAFAREGADIVVSYQSSIENEDARDTAKWVKQAGRKALLIKGDIRKEKHCALIINKCISKFGRIDVLINNAGFHLGQENLQSINLTEWDRTFDTNVKAMFMLCKLAEPHMKAGSCILNTSSVTAYQPSEQLLPYSATKSAIQNFTANLAAVYLKQGNGIRVNAIAPGITWTPLIPATKLGFNKSGENTPIHRPAQPAEMAPAYVFLASEDAGYISGITLPITGGKTAY